MTNVMVFPCGSEIGLEINNALKFNKDIKLYGLSSTASHGSVVYENYIEGVPFINDDSFIEELNKIIEKNKIDFLIPAYDDVVLYFAKNKDKILCDVIVASEKVCGICRSKKETYDYFNEYDFVPKTYNENELEKAQYPLFAKPDIGQGSQGVAIVKNYDEAKSIVKSDIDYVFSELLEKEEYTVDCFSDGEKIVYMSMRERIRVRTGISVQTKVENVPVEVLDIATKINDKLKMQGVWFFQVKKDKNDIYKLLEIAPRVAGSMCVSRIRGFNYILNSIYLKKGYSIDVIEYPIADAEVDRAFISRYRLNIEYNTIYIDFDDTLTNKGKVNVRAIQLIYQWLNENKKIILITRHAKDIYNTLKEYKIDKNIFSEIIHLDLDERKSKYVKDEKSIFIDDSFRERADVSKNKKIPVFDVDAMESLLDWRG
ncbi:putative ATP-grasp superfamily ATP-dependent carboligase [Bacilli bacterium PM5-3]|nr:putative ATP-grasp superfamily ATP-dependent carboligase [Bacilli bacterium PM5-3]